MNNQQSRLEFGQRLRLARNARGYDTASDFARVAEFKIHTYAKWEQGITKPRATADLVKICTLLDVSSDWLITGNERGLSVDMVQRLKKAAASNTE